MKVLALVNGPKCPSCGRDNSNYANICTSDDCPGVQLYVAAPDLLEAAKNARNVLAGLVTGDLKTIKADSPALVALRAAIAKAEGVR